MSGKGPNPADFAGRIERAIHHGADLVDALRGAPRGSRELQQAHRAAEQQRRRTAARYERRRRTAVGGAVVAGAGGAVGVLATAVGAGALGIPLVVIAGIGAALSGLSFARLRREGAPRIGPASVPPPPMLPRGAIGATEVGRLVQVRVQIFEVAASVQQLHPDAAADLRSADAEAAVPLTRLAERLAVLHRLAQQMPDSTAASAARDSAAIVARRLGDGCSTYEDLLAAAARLLAAPDAARSTEAVLGPALQAMIAYAHGLQRSAEVLDPSA